MMRFPRKPRSLRFTLHAFTSVVVVVVILLCSVILLYEYHSINTLTNSLDTINTFNRFSTSLSYFDQTFNLYANNLNRNSLETCYELIETLSATAEKMVAEFPGEGHILDNQLLTETYLSDAKRLLDTSAILSEPEFWKQYEQLSQQLTKINENARYVQYFYLRNVSTMSSHAIDLWNLQLRITVITMIIIVLMMTLFIRRFIARITSPIMNLVHAAKHIMQGDFSQEPVPCTDSSQEIILLTNTFAYMSETITRQMSALQDKLSLSERLHRLELQNINIQLSLTEKEMYLMQSMINPHFLFNCLGTVSSMAVLENAPRTQDIATKIARYLRSSIDLVGSRLTISEELRLLQQYLYIQSVRFGERITTSIQCDPACEDIIVPAMFLQPIVENSIVHGLRNCMHGGQINVTIAMQENEMVRITVVDNGSGMTPERLEHLRTAIHRPFQSGQDCIGLHSIISQLDIMFDKHYTFEIDSQPRHGTQTQIVFPTTPVSIGATPSPEDIPHRKGDAIDPE